MAEQILPFFWMGVALMLIVALAVLTMTLWEVRKTVKSLSIISDRVAYLTDVKAWIGLLTSWRRRKDPKK
ncbi:MAG: hypothetical protein HPY65_08985 [Syntrophaceae bacterium]|nr:hypothetical protein [Syntrophaceae bacterium]